MPYQEVDGIRFYSVTVQTLENPEDHTLWMAEDDLVRLAWEKDFTVGHRFPHPIDHKASFLDPDAGTVTKPVSHVLTSLELDPNDSVELKSRNDWPSSYDHDDLLDNNL